MFRCQVLYLAKELVVGYLWRSHRPESSQRLPRTLQCEFVHDRGVRWCVCVSRNRDGLPQERHVRRLWAGGELCSVQRVQLTGSVRPTRGCCWSQGVVERHRPQLLYPPRVRYHAHVIGTPVIPDQTRPYNTSSAWVVQVSGRVGYTHRRSLLFVSVGNTISRYSLAHVTCIIEYYKYAQIRLDNLDKPVAWNLSYISRFWIIKYTVHLYTANPCMKKCPNKANSELW